MTYKMIVMMGGQGVGKGTHAKKLIDLGGFQYIEAGAILRSLPADSKLAQIMARGELVPDADLFELLAEKFNVKHDVIVDGFPRTIGQAQWLVQNFANKFDVQVLYLNVPEKVMLERIQNRIREGGGRADDADPSVVRRRLDNFWKTTVPAIEWLRNAPGIKFSDVDVSEFDFEKNFNKVLTAVNLRNSLAH